MGATSEDGAPMKSGNVVGILLLGEVLRPGLINL